MIFDRIKDKVKDRTEHLQEQMHRDEPKADPLIVNVEQRNYTYWKTAWVSAAHVRRRRR